MRDRTGSAAPGVPAANRFIVPEATTRGYNCLAAFAGSRQFPQLLPMSDAGLVPGRGASILACPRLDKPLACPDKPEVCPNLGKQECLPHETGPVLARMTLAPALPEPLGPRRPSLWFGHHTRADCAPNFFLNQWADIHKEKTG